MEMRTKLAIKYLDTVVEWYGVLRSTHTAMEFRKMMLISENNFLLEVSLNVFV